MEGGEYSMAKRGRPKKIQEKTVTKQAVVALQKRVKRGEVLDVLKEIESVNGGMITPRDVVNEARDPESKLHHLFDWNDRTAGEKYRLMQARILLNTVKVEYLGEQKQGYFNASVEIGDEKVRGYFPLERVVSEEELYKDVLRQAVNELEYAQRKYNSITELRGVINLRKLKRVKRLVTKR